jgi:hypothetical protein
VLEGLADYVRAMDPAACPRRDEPVKLASYLRDVETAVALAAGADPDTRRLLLGAARTGLGAIDARFRRPGLERSRDVLRDADAELAAIREGGGDLAAWRQRWPARKRRLLRDERRSLFNPRRVQEALAP